MSLRSTPIFLRSTLPLLLAITAVMVAGKVEAQGWMADRQRTEGPGIRVGDLEIHPGIGVEIGYDTNLYYTSDTPGARLPPRTESAVLRVTPHLQLSTLGDARRREGEASAEQTTPSVIAFRGGVRASYYEFFADESRRNVSIDAALRLTITPSPIFSLAVFDEFGRSIRPFTENTSPSTSTARDQNRAGLDVTFSTAGNVFQVRAGYRFSLDYFEGSDFQYGNTMTHTVELQETFRFLPQTAIIHETTVGYRDYFSGLVGPTAVFDSTYVQSRIGLNGAITPEISIGALVGYAAGFADSSIPGYDQDYESVVAQAQLGWAFMENARFTLGYQRTFNPSFVGNYYSMDRGFVGLQMMFGGQFLVGLDGGVAYVDFGQIVAPDGMMVGTSTERSDIRVDASLFAEYRFTDWLGVNGTFSYYGDFTNFQYLLRTPAMTALDPAGYNKIELWLGVRVFY